MKQIKDLPASIHARLANLAKDQNRPFQEVFSYYVMERFLYRFVQSPYSQTFVLKGGLMFLGWGLPLRRPTRDIDVQGYLSNSGVNLSEVVRKVCLQEVEPDGLRFDPEFVYTEQIIENAEYQGERVHFKAYLGNANLQTHIDFSFGNVISPAEIVVTYPTLLDMPRFQIRGYPVETAIAEKFQAMVYWQIVNTRIKDYYDIYLLSQHVEILGMTLIGSIYATFQARDTYLPRDIPVALSDEFAIARQSDWTTFLNRSSIIDIAPDDFLAVIQQLRFFLLPPMHAAREGSLFALRWLPGGPWTK